MKNKPNIEKKSKKSKIDKNSLRERLEELEEATSTEAQKEHAISQHFKFNLDIDSIEEKPENLLTPDNNLIQNELLVDLLIENTPENQVDKLFKKGLNITNIILFDLYKSLLKGRNVPIEDLFLDINDQTKIIAENQKKIRESLKTNPAKYNFRFSESQTPLDMLIQSTLSNLFTNKNFKKHLDSQADNYSSKCLLYLDNLATESGERLTEYIDSRINSEASLEELIVDAAICLFEEKNSIKQIVDLSHKIDILREKASECGGFLNQPLELNKNLIAELNQLKDKIDINLSETKRIKQEYSTIKKSGLGYNFNLPNLETCFEHNSNVINSLAAVAVERTRNLVSEYISKYTEIAKQNNPEERESTDENQFKKYDEWTLELSQLKIVCWIFNLEEVAETNKLIQILENQKYYFSQKLRIKLEIEKDIKDIISKKTHLETYFVNIPIFENIDSIITKLKETSIFLTTQKQKYESEQKTLCLKTGLSSHSASCNSLESLITTEINSLTQLADNIILTNQIQTQDIESDIKDTEELINKTKFAESLYTKFKLYGIVPDTDVKIQVAKEKIKNLEDLLKELNTIRNNILSINSIESQYKNNQSLLNNTFKIGYALDKGIEILLQMHKEIKQLEQTAESAIKSTEKCSRRQYLESPVSNYNNILNSIKSNIQTRTNEVKYCLDKSLKEKIKLTSILEEDINSTLSFIKITERLEDLYLKLKELGINTEEKSKETKEKQQKLEYILKRLNEAKLIVSELNTINSNYDKLLAKSNNLFSVLEQIKIFSDINEYNQIEQSMQSHKQALELKLKPLETILQTYYTDKIVNSILSKDVRIEDILNQRIGSALEQTYSIIDLSIPIVYPLEEVLDIIADITNQLHSADLFFEEQTLEEKLNKIAAKQNTSIANIKADIAKKISTLNSQKTQLENIQNDKERVDKLKNNLLDYRTKLKNAGKSWFFYNDSEKNADKEIIRIAELSLEEYVNIYKINEGNLYIEDIYELPQNPQEFKGVQNKEREEFNLFMLSEIRKAKKRVISQIVTRYSSDFNKATGYTYLRYYNHLKELTDEKLETILNLTIKLTDEICSIDDAPDYSYAGPLLQPQFKYIRNQQNLLHNNIKKAKTNEERDLYSRKINLLANIENYLTGKNAD